MQQKPETKPNEKQWADMHIVDFLNQVLDNTDYHDLQSIVKNYFTDKGHSVRPHPTDVSQVSVEIT